MSVLTWLWDLLTYPVRTWTGYEECTVVDTFYRSVNAGSRTYCTTHESEPFWAAVSAIFIWGLSLAILAIVVAGVARLVVWWQLRQARVPCQHCSRLTNDVGTIQVSTCRLGDPCCEDCFALHPRQAAEERLRTELANGALRCPQPRCGRQMDKHIDDELLIIVDVCPADGSIFLSSDEHAALLRHAEQEGYDQGHSDGKSTGTTNGLLLGLVIGNAGN